MTLVIVSIQFVFLPLKLFLKIFLAKNYFFNRKIISDACSSPLLFFLANNSFLRRDFLGWKFFSLRFFSFCDIKNARNEQLELNNYGYMVAILGLPDNTFCVYFCSFVATLVSSEKTKFLVVPFI